MILYLAWLQYFGFMLLRVIYFTQKDIPEMFGD